MVFSVDDRSFKQKFVPV